MSKALNLQTTIDGFNFMQSRMSIDLTYEYESKHEHSIGINVK